MSAIATTVAGFCLLLSSAVSIHAANIVVSGSVTGLAGPNNDQIDQWRTNTVPKTMDADLDNVYGTAGYVMYATDEIGNANTGVVIPADPLNYANGSQATLKSIPSYLTLANNGQDHIAASFATVYKLMDNPTQPIGAAVSDVESGAAVRLTSLGTEVSLLNITIGTGFPTSGLRIGLLFGNTDNFLGTLRLSQTVGGSATSTFMQTIPPAEVELGLVFFDITAANVGDNFTLFISKENPQPPGGNTNTNVLYGGITFDVIPEPASASLLLAGVTVLCQRRRGRLKG
jgi:hypothetical protein